MTTTNNKVQIEITSENLTIAKSRIQEMATSKKLVIEGEISTLVPVTYPSKSKMKELEDKLQKQEEFKKKFSWTVGIILGIGILIQYLSTIYRNLKP